MRKGLLSSLGGGDGEDLVLVVLCGREQDAEIRCRVKRTWFHSASSHDETSPPSPVLMTPLVSARVVMSFKWSTAMLRDESEPLNKRKGEEVDAHPELARGTLREVDVTLLDLEVALLEFGFKVKVSGGEAVSLEEVSAFGVRVLGLCRWVS